MVEFAFVSFLFVLLLTGLISFGLILSFKQNLTQATAEGARAGATAPSGDAADEAQAATESAVASFDKECGANGMACTFQVDDCGEDPPDGFNDPDERPDCIYVSLIYDYDTYPILPDFPILSALYPSTLSASNSAEVNP